MTNTPELPDCAGCTDPRSEGTHAMGTKQHPGNTPEQEREGWWVLDEEPPLPSGAVVLWFGKRWGRFALPEGLAREIAADHAAATALDVVVKVLQRIADQRLLKGSEYLAKWNPQPDEGDTSACGLAIEALSHPAVVARLEGK